MSKYEEEKRRHEYLLMELRLTGEDIKNSIRDKFEPRIMSLEKTRAYLKGIGKGLTVAGATLVTYWKFGHHLK